MNYQFLIITLMFALGAFFVTPAKSDWGDIFEDLPSDSSSSSSSEEDPRFRPVKSEEKLQDEKNN
uniref:Putative salivary secreted mucin n=1 Tax=Xenopsylla cheopis TaxID=163159 RepID=A2IAE7_XENCH|nr:putative salivary secreted mucin [Xenopsylla cheopis]